MAKSDKNFLLNYLRGLNQANPKLCDVFLEEAGNRGLCSPDYRSNLNREFARKNYNSLPVGRAKFMIKGNEDKTHEERF